MYKDLSHSNVIDTVSSIQFCLSSPEEVLRRSVVEVVSHEIYMGTEPAKGGVLDMRMGTIDNGKRCPTCGLRNTMCPGHFGHIELARPVFYVQFMDVMKKLLKCVCFKCGSIIISKEEVANMKRKIVKMARAKRFDVMYQLAKNKKECWCCKCRLPSTISRETTTKFILEWKKDNKEDGATDDAISLFPEDVEKIFKRISDEDAEMLGFSAILNRPEWMICSIFPVPPPCVRPTVHNDIGQRREDDLTHKICEIVKYNNTIKTKMANGASRKEIDALALVLQYHVATYADNKIPGMPPACHRNGRSIKSITERLKHKEGRIRGNLMGKRVDYSARSVITPDPNISIDEVGVPVRIAMNLTFPDIVNDYNKEYLQEMVNNGPNIYPGAKFVEKTQEQRTIKIGNNIAITIENGDVVYRHLINGDPVLFNRQPSLHKMSMMCHRVRVMSYDTFRLNVCVCAPYNADMDGDEMNMHVPQSIQTAMELRQLAAVPLQIISPRTSSPIIGIIQDLTVGVFRLTQPDTKVSRRDMFNLLSVVSNFSGKVKVGKEFTGSQVFSHVIPRATYFMGKSVEIQDGQILKGVLSNGKDGSSGKIFANILHNIYREHGPDSCRKFLDDTQRLICEWLCLTGFSMGVSDLVLNEDTNVKVKETIVASKREVDKVVQSIHDGTFVNDTIFSVQDHFESRIRNILSTCGDKVSENLKFDIKKNRMINMIESGAKGSMVNVMQMIGTLGSQAVEEDKKRVPYGFDDRTLPHFAKFDDSARARGFVENSFITGLAPYEYFFHAMAGREGLIDTAVKTSDTGYIQRKLVKSMEDCKIHFDMTVRNVSGTIIQYAYGGDGFDSTKLDVQVMPTVRMTQAEIKDEYLLTKDDYPKLHDEIVPRFTAYYENVLKDRAFFIKHVAKGKRDATVFFPVNMGRIMLYARNMFNRGRKLKTELDPTFVLDAIDELLKTLVINKLKDQSPMVGIMLRAYLNPKALVVKYGLSRPAFDYIIDKVKQQFIAGIAHPSELVGILAAQSIGEPSTQMTLNSVEWNTELMIVEHGDVRRVKIGEFIDDILQLENLLPDNRNIENHPNDTVFCWINERDVKIMSCNENGHVTWKDVEAITRHPPINEDGSNTLVKVVTKSGREVIATKAKSFLKRVDNKILPVRGDEVKVGDFLPISTKIDFERHKKLWNGFALDKSLGYFMGMFFSRGIVMFDCIVLSCELPIVEIDDFCASNNIKSYIFKDSSINKICKIDDDLSSEWVSESLLGCTNHNVDTSYRICDQNLVKGLKYATRIPPEFIAAPPEFCVGFAVAYLKHMPRTSSIDPVMRVDLQQLLGRAYINIRTDNMRLSEVQDMVPDVVTSEHGTQHIVRSRIQELIESSTCEADKEVYRNIMNEDVMYDEVVDVIEVTSANNIYVYDLTVKDTQNFNIYNGICMRDTFHLSGVASASKSVQGVPRLKELLDASKNIKTPQMKIFVRKTINNDQDKCQTLLNELETTYLKDIVTESSIYYDPSDSTSDIDNDKLFLSAWNQFETDVGCNDGATYSPWVLRFEFDKEIVLDKGLTMYDIYYQLTSMVTENIRCVYADDNFDKLIMRIRIPDGKVRDFLYDLKLLEQQLLDEVMLKGVSSIKKVVKHKEKFDDTADKRKDFVNGRMFDDDIGEFHSWEEFVLETDGTNLLDVLAHPLVDPTLTISNDVLEIYEVLGVEAACNALLHEIKTTLDGLPVQDRHLELLVDVIACKGHIMSINRHGINRGDNGPLAKCSFEESAGMLINAGVFAEVDKMNGVSANVMLGQIPACGTGDSKLLVDFDKLTRAYKPENVSDVIDGSYCMEGLDMLSFDFDSIGSGTYI